MDMTLVHKTSEQATSPRPATRPDEPTRAASPPAAQLSAAAPPPPLRSCLYTCAIRHHRLRPRPHQFTHHIFMLALDLDEIDEVARRIHGFSHNRSNFYAFRDRDHLTLPEMADAPLKDHVLAWVAAQGVVVPAQAASVRVTLLTLPRVLGHLFNPVSFFFLEHAASGQPIGAVAEVGNTFGEMKPYFIPPAGADGRFRLHTRKHFYVSPFSRLDLWFNFKLQRPNEHLELHVDEDDGTAPVLLSSLTGRRQPLTTRRLWSATLACPFVTLKVIALIHWHALRLWLKRIPWFAKTAHPERQRDVLRPHHSLSRNHP